MAAMKQLVVRYAPKSQHHRHVEAVEMGFMGTVNLGEWDYTPILGTPALIDVAFELRDAGFEIVGAGLVDSHSQPNDTEEGDALEHDFAQALQNRDQGALTEMLNSAFRGLDLGYVDVVDPASNRFTVFRDGSIRTPRADDESLVDVVSRYVESHG